MLLYCYIAILIFGQQSWFIGSLFTPNIFVYSCFFVRRRAAGLPKASQSLPKASQSLPKHPQSIPKASQSLPKASQKPPKASPKPPQITPSYQRGSPDASRAETRTIVIFPTTTRPILGRNHHVYLGALYSSRKLNT